MSFGRNYTKPPRAMPKRSSIAPSSPVRMADARSIMRMPAAEEPRKKPHQKTPDRVQQSIRDSARGEECTVRLPGVCNHNPETTVWSHAPFGDAGKGMGLKAIDLAGCFCCAACHDVVDGRAPRPDGMNRQQVLVEWFFGHLRSLVILRQKGLV